MMATEDGPTFEDRLLAELKAMVVENPAPEPIAGRRRRPYVITAAAAALVAAAAAVLVPALVGHGGSSAYAVTRHSGGTVSLTVRGLIPHPGAMQNDLRAAGARPVSVISATGYRGSCHPAAQNLPLPSGLLRGTGPNAFVIDPARLPTGAVLIAQVPTKSGTPDRVSISLSRDGTPPCAT
jgi:hypothetical protein